MITYSKVYKMDKAYNTVEKKGNQKVYMRNALYWHNRDNANKLRISHSFVG